MDFHSAHHASISHMRSFVPLFRSCPLHVWVSEPNYLVPKLPRHFPVKACAAQFCATLPISHHAIICQDPGTAAVAHKVALCLVVMVNFIGFGARRITGTLCALLCAMWPIGQMAPATFQTLARSFDSSHIVFLVFPVYYPFTSRIPAFPAFAAAILVIVCRACIGWSTFVA